MKPRVAKLLLILAAAILAPGVPRAKDAELRVEPSVFVAGKPGEARQLFYLSLPADFPRQFKVLAESGQGSCSENFQLLKDQSEVSLLAPACPKNSCRVNFKILGADQKLLAEKTVDQAPVRPWKIFVAPFTHIDIGFTQSQRLVLAQNLQNLRNELELIERTASYPEKSRFKLFTEVSWAVDEFLSGETTSAGDKAKLAKAISTGMIEPGAFYISHQNRFMPAEAIYLSVLPGLMIAEQTGTPLATACIHDVLDFSNVVRPLSAAGVKYLMVGPNDSRYAVPPLFYLSPPIGSEKILVWHATGLNGYGENFDLKMRLNLPLQETEFAQMEKLVSEHLKGLEQGYPTQKLARFYDYYGANWPYPYDAFLLPFYPAQGGDNQQQNIVPSEIARKWNEKWSSPELIIATPREFFEYAEKNYQGRIPAIKGEMAGFWGEQIFLDLVQVDPWKQASQQKFETQAINAGAAMVDRFLAGDNFFNPLPELWPAYKKLILNNDHNPRPVPFGGEKYTKENVQEWKDTRGQWIEEIRVTGDSVFAQACPGQSCELDVRPAVPAATSRAFQQGEKFVLENQYYRVTVADDCACVRSIIDKELGKELVRPGSQGLNKYLVAVRGENAGLRGYLKSKPGFKAWKISIDNSDPLNPSLMIKGKMDRSVNASQALAKFAKKAFGVPVPAPLVKALAKAAFIKGGKPLELSQQIILPAGEKRIEFAQNFSGGQAQWAEHVFSYPLNFPADTPVLYDSGYSLLSFSPGPPLGSGDIIPAAKNLEGFPSINFSLAPFSWMYAMPPGFSFNNYVLLKGDGFAAAFASVESKALLPGPLEHDPEKGPFGGEFSLIGLGFTLWGKAGLGADVQRPATIHSALTSFAVADLPDAREKAFWFGRKFGGYSMPAGIQLEPPSAAVVSAWPENDSALVLRLWEVSGKNVKAKVKLDSVKKLKQVWLARSDGKSQSAIPFSDQSFSLPIPAGEVRTVRVEFAP